MCKHEEKHCPRCHSAFECKVGDITQCQCYGLSLTEEEKAFIADRYEDCLCRNCLMELKQRPGGIIFITGGARSGKSRHAQELALEMSDKPVYVATARSWDDDFRERIRRHQSERDERWTSLEEEKYISRLELQGKVAVIDCVTLWLTNFFVDTKNDIEASLEACKKEIDALCRIDAVLIVISNEIGLGGHAETEIGRKFTDLQGWVNQYIAQKSRKVILMISGIPVIIKDTSLPAKN
jgi:adenosylcobinamide kinase/adenosylcobinamide-phosphate guanylyltransferase